MKEIDQYLKWVEWSDEDQAYIGRCPNLITGIHGDDPITLYQELHEDIEDLATVAERRNEPTISHDELVDELKKDALL